MLPSEQMPGIAERGVVENPISNFGGPPFKSCGLSCQQTASGSLRPARESVINPNFRRGWSKRHRAGQRGRSQVSYYLQATTSRQRAVEWVLGSAPGPGPPRSESESESTSVSESASLSESTSVSESASLSDSASVSESGSLSE